MRLILAKFYHDLLMRARPRSIANDFKIPFFSLESGDLKFYLLGAWSWDRYVELLGRGIKMRLPRRSSMRAIGGAYRKTACEINGAWSRPFDPDCDGGCKVRASDDFKTGMGSARRLSKRLLWRLHQRGREDHGR